VYVVGEETGLFLSVRPDDAVGISYLFSFLFSFWSSGGTCWLQRMENGKCNKLYTKNITRDECCRAGYDMGYTDRDVSQVEAFFADAFNDGVTCSSCLRKIMPVKLCLRVIFSSFDSFASRKL
jgi:hypothetical protein